MTNPGGTTLVTNAGSNGKFLGVLEVVTFSPGIDLLLKDMLFPGKIRFSACNNTKQGMEKAEGHAVSILHDATVVPSGVVHLMELQEQGRSYVRP